jgi:hypothetical protein
MSADVSLTAPRRGLSLRAGIAIAAALVAGGALIQFVMGRNAICPCGTIRLWYGDPNGPEGSQHITDWYTFSHIIHGFVFYGACWLFARWRRVPFSVGLALVAATAVEVGWELLENSPLIIERYRTVTVSRDYLGDSILNSVSDMLAMAAGFAVARLSPVWLTVALGVAMEVFCAWLIRDNLTLNVIMLLYPLEWIKTWQAGG